MLHIGYFGFGKSATRYHLPYVLLRKNIQVKTICYPTTNVALESPYAEHNITFTQDEAVLLTDPVIELIVICTPPSTHFDLAKKAIEHGKNVLVEKPFCSTVAEADALLELAKAKGVFCVPFQNRRFDSDFLAVKEVLQSGKIGDLVEIESHFDYFRTDNLVQKGTKYDGAFYGLGVHTIDQIISLFGKPDKVVYDIRSVRNNLNPDDTFEVQLFYGNTKAIVKTSHLVKIEYPKFIVHGKMGSFVKYGIDQQEACLKHGIMPEESGFGEDGESYYGQAEYLDIIGNDVAEIIPTPRGDYGRVYDNIYAHLRYNERLYITENEIRIVMTILERGFEQPTPHVIDFK